MTSSVPSEISHDGRAKVSESANLVVAAIDERITSAKYLSREPYDNVVHKNVHRKSRLPGWLKSIVYRKDFERVVGERITAALVSLETGDTAHIERLTASDDWNRYLMSLPGSGLSSFQVYTTANAVAADHSSNDINGNPDAYADLAAWVSTAQVFPLELQ